MLRIVPQPADPSEAAKPSRPLALTPPAGPPPTADEDVGGASREAGAATGASTTTMAGTASPANHPASLASAASADRPELGGLVARAAEGDVAAFERLIGAYQAKVFTFALGFARNREEASDLAQEALIKVYRSIGSFRFQSSFSTWLYSIVKNVFLDSYKSRAARERALETPIDEEIHHLSEAAHAEDRLLREDERRALFSALRRVPPTYRTVVVMFDVQGISYDEIARVLDVPVGTVKSRLKRGRDALREQIFRSMEKDP